MSLGETLQKVQFRADPLAPAAGLFLLGGAVGIAATVPRGWVLSLALAAWVLWLAMEIRAGRSTEAGRIVAQVALAVAIGCCGMLLTSLAAQAVANDQIARFAPDRGEGLITCRAQVVSPPAGEENIGNLYWIAEVSEVWTDRGWVAASGDVLVKSAGGRTEILNRGARLEMNGWLSRPLPALNPGALDPRRRLAADRIFAEIRVPRPGGITVLSAAPSQGPGFLARLPLFLRGKLLEHTQQQDVPAADTLSALLLGYRDPAISDISRAFSDAGVAHLLAISGSHIVFLAAMVWAILRFIPMRPRRREMLVAAIIVAYVLATPCGPPIIRATAAVLAVFFARMMGRAPRYLNTLAAAAIFVVLIRPADIADAGFQLTFVTTAALILLSPRLHAALFEEWLARLALVADLGGSFWQRFRLRAAKILAAVIVGNGIGAISAAPLVAIHFGQVNLWGIVTGFIALPMVALAMAVGMVQLLAELLWSGLGEWLSPLTVHIGQGLVWMIRVLAGLPGAAVALRPVPVWLVIAIYAGFLTWMARRSLGISRATIVNVAVAIAALFCGWITFSAPRGEACVTVLSAGTSSSMLLRTPDGRIWCINAGAPQGASVVESAIRPAMRVAGVRHWDCQLITSLDASHAGEAADVIAAFSPRMVWTSAAAWDFRGQTLAGAQVEDIARKQKIPVKTLQRPDALDLGNGVLLHALWPPPGAGEKNPAARGLILLLEFQNRRILIADPASIDALALALSNEPELKCDAVVFTGPERGGADEPLRRLISPLQPKGVLWTGRGNWAPRQSAPGELNSADGAVRLTIQNGQFVIQPMAAP